MGRAQKSRPGTCLLGWRSPTLGLLRSEGQGQTGATGLHQSQLSPSPFQASSARANLNREPPPPLLPPRPWHNTHTQQVLRGRPSNRPGTCSHPLKDFTPPLPSVESSWGCTDYRNLETNLSDPAQSHCGHDRPQELTPECPGDPKEGRGEFPHGRSLGGRGHARHGPQQLSAEHCTWTVCKPMQVLEEGPSPPLRGAHTGWRDCAGRLKPGFLSAKATARGQRP